MSGAAVSDRPSPPSTPSRPSPAVRWARLVLGLAAVVVGAVLVFSPFASLGVFAVLLFVGLVVTGVLELIEARRSGSSLVTGLAWLAAAAVLLLWPGLTLRGIAVVVGIALVVAGIGRLWRAVRGHTDERLAEALNGVAGVIFGVLALSWPDVTVFVLAVVFGARTVLFGITQVVTAVRRPRDVEPVTPGATPPGSPRTRRPWWRRWLATAGAVAGLLVALVLVAVSLGIRQGAPQPDAFYDPPEDVPSEPGQLIRSEPFTRALPDGAEGYRILYTTTRQDGEPDVASGLVVRAADAGDDPQPVIAWAHGTTGVAPGCAPSVLDDPFEAGAFFLGPEVVANGWTLVATDYVGLGAGEDHPYLVGEPAGRSVLDAVRAARQLEDVTLSEQTVVWGHSQGGHAALWTGIVAPDYAPDVSLAGVAALAPASDLPGLVGNLDTLPGGAIFASYVVEGYADAYDDVTYGDAVRPAANVLVGELAGRCLAEPAALVSVAESLVIDRPVIADDAVDGPFGERLAENVPAGPIEAPLFLGQGETDPLVLPEAQAGFAELRCDGGGVVEYRTYPGRDHVGVVQADSPLVPDLLQWTEDRLAGEAADSTCEG